MNPSILGFLMLLAILTPGRAAEVRPPKGDGSDAAPTRENADRFAILGMRAMEESDGDAKRAVDAAVAFSQALEMYQAQGDDDAVRDMQANIFWCKKRMNVDSLDEFVAKKADLRTYARMIERITTEEVTADQAGDYLARAQRAMAEDPDNHFRIAIRFSEIIDRFPDSDEAKEAQVVFAREQSAYLAQVRKERAQDHAQVQQAIDQARRNVFALATPAVAGKTIPAPDKAALKDAVATVRSLYKADLARTRDVQKRAAARKLAEEAGKSRQDAAIYYAMLQESIRLAGDSEDYLLLMADCEKLSESFTDAPQFRQELAKRRAKPTAVAILKLLDEPMDKPANAQAGRFFCFSLNAWESGLPLLQQGNDEALHALAEMELAGPANDAERKQIGDGWYDYGKKAAADRVAAWGRSLAWYEKIRSSADGVVKVQIEQRIAEMGKVMPLAIVDYATIAPEQWDRLKGTMVVVKANGGRTAVGASLAPGQRVRVVPHPTDTWINGYYTGSYESTWTGYDWKSHQTAIWRGMEDGGRFTFGALVCQVGGDALQKPGIISGSGPITLMPYLGTGTIGHGDSGAIRVKILAVGDDE